MRDEIDQPDHDATRGVRRAAWFSTVFLWLSAPVVYVVGAAAEYDWHTGPGPDSAAARGLEPWPNPPWPLDSLWMWLLVVGLGLVSLLPVAYLARQRRACRTTWIWVGVLGLCLVLAVRLVFRHGVYDVWQAIELHRSTVGPSTLTIPSPPDRVQEWRELHEVGLVWPLGALLIGTLFVWLGPIRRLRDPSPEPPRIPRVRSILCTALAGVAFVPLALWNYFALIDDRYRHVQVAGHFDSHHLLVGLVAFVAVPTMFLSFARHNLPFMLRDKWVAVGALSFFVAAIGWGGVADTDCDIRCSRFDFDAAFESMSWAEMRSALRAGHRTSWWMLATWTAVMWGGLVYWGRRCVTVPSES